MKTMKKENKMNIKRIVSVIMTAVMAISLSAGEFSTQTGEGVKKITVQNESIRQITCEGEDFSTNIIGTKNKNVELYFTSKPFTEEQLRAVQLKSDETSKTDAKLTIDKKELKIDLVKKHNDGKYITIFTPKDISIIVTLANGDLSVKDIKGELLLDGKNMDTDIRNVAGVINYRNKSGDLKVDNFEGVLDIKTFSGDIMLKKVSGSIKVENKSGDFDLSGFNGKLKSTFQVGDIKISASTVTEADIDNQSGDVMVTGVSGDKLSVISSMGGIVITDSKLNIIKVELSAGELEVKGSESDLNISLNMGEAKITGHKLSGKSDSDVKVSFGDVTIGLKDPASYDYFLSVGDEKTEYKSGMEIDDDLRICEKNKKCLRINNKMGSVTVK